jgi:uncharacterized glyoxalase superfamily protein PhnB
MTDPFDALGTPLVPVAPAPEFARRLRARIERAFTLPKGVTVSNLDFDVRDQLDSALDASAPGDSAAVPDVADVVAAAAAAAVAAAPVMAHAVITPYLAVAGASEAIEWYRNAFGARKRGEPIVMPDGRVGHAELEIGGALIMLADEFPDIGHTAPTSDLGVHVTLHLGVERVEDVDSVIDRAVSAGAHLERPPADYEYGRNGGIRDPFGHRWIISAEPSTEPSAEPAAPTAEPAEPTAEPARPLRHGDIGYLSLWVPDVERADRFFSSVLGWTYSQASGPQGRQVEGLALHHGLWGGEPRSTLFCCFAVDDLEVAIARVRAAGGTADEPQVEPYGTISGCVDDQGVRFALFVPPGGPGRAASVARSGVDTDEVLAYVTMEVPDSAKTRAFYGSVLGWRFAQGRVEDGWQVENVSPMVGISGGHALATTVPMYRVADIARAVELVWAAGGSASEPETQPYGITSTCADDQGTRFYLGQL